MKNQDLELVVTKKSLAIEARIAHSFGDGTVVEMEVVRRLPGLRMVTLVDPSTGHSAIATQKVFYGKGAEKKTPVAVAWEGFSPCWTEDRNQHHKQKRNNVPPLEMMVNKQVSQMINPQDAMDNEPQPGPDAWLSPGDREFKQQWH